MIGFLDVLQALDAHSKRANMIGIADPPEPAVGSMDSKRGDGTTCHSYQQRPLTDQQWYRLGLVKATIRGLFLPSTVTRRGLVRIGGRLLYLRLSRAFGALPGLLLPPPSVLLLSRTPRCFGSLPFFGLSLCPLQSALGGLSCTVRCRVRSFRCVVSK